MNFDPQTPVVVYSCFPLLQGLVEPPVPRSTGSRSTRQSDRQPVDTVKVSAVMVDVTPEPVDSPVPAGLAGADGSTNSVPPLARQVALEDDLSMEEEVVADLDFGDSVVGGPTSTFLRSADMIADLAVDVTISVSSPADLAGDVTIGVSSRGRPCWRCHCRRGTLGRCWGGVLGQHC